MVIQIKLFGPLKHYGEGGVLALELSGECTVGQLKQQLKAYLQATFPQTFQAALVDSSVFADERRVLTDGERLPSTLSLALLPPVCGG